MTASIVTKESKGLVAGLILALGLGHEFVLIVDVNWIFEGPLSTADIRTSDRPSRFQGRDP
jgi:adenine/guanine phosphoribosyltransferase-like PRPP-binding protein